MSEYSSKILRQRFLDWHRKYGSTGHDYPTLLDDLRRRIDVCTINPTRGHQQAANLNKSVFPPLGQHIFGVTSIERVREMFDESNNDRIGDDRTVHNAIGSYALFLRLLFPEEWMNEPFWDGDLSAPGGRHRLATLASRGFDYLNELEKKKATYKMDKYLAAIRTKPFVLLAGISGTGKSRLVRQLARGCCPKNKSEGVGHPLYDEGKPGNFEMIQVRPNWHDSSELMGYVSRIVKAGDPPKYVMTPFVEFLAKAWVYREVPFFLCLDEMNLAPVEQYFAEYLSVIETRKLRTLGPEGKTIEVISTDPIIRWESLEQATLKNAIKDLFDGKEWAAKAEHGRVEEIEKLIAHDKGIRIPPNLVVMGTVNMDETTCSFSRKVLDRAMSFELNDVTGMYDPAKLGTERECDFATIPATATEAKLLTGKEAYDSPVGQTIAIADSGMKVGDAILKILKTLNEEDVPAKKDDGSDDTGRMFLLAKTPFKIAYRTRNEIMIYCVERIGNGLVALPQALDEAISMKILSRIEGDSQHVQRKWLLTLSAAIESELSKLDGYVAAKCSLCKEKLADMAAQADYGYTSFWTR